MGALGNMALRIYPQTFLLDAMTNISEASNIGVLSELAQALLKLLRQNNIPDYMLLSFCLPWFKSHLEQKNPIQNSNSVCSKILILLGIYC